MKSPSCPKCSIVMCEQFDDKPGPNSMTLAVPNGTYRCYRCGYTIDPKQQSSMEKLNDIIRDSYAGYPNAKNTKGMIRTAVEAAYDLGLRDGRGGK